MKLETAANQLEALGNSTRLGIIRILIQAGEDGVLVGDIQKRMDVPASTLSHHLARLVQAGLMKQERQSRMLFCKANYKNMDRLVDYLMKNCCAEDG